MGRRGDDRVRVYEVYEVRLEMDLEPRYPDDWEGWEARRQPREDIGMQVIREAMRTHPCDPARLRDSEDVEGQVRVMQVTHVRSGR